ncbi:phasin family protein [Candidatus Tisiphia endosymbiont of Nemotelus uliginosus]|uniref:phasin family protein n=1 Tax=Candidatus Tisiphia endosymbiont of Nemotelus uliginosus TaxID=3077926 RepID=UPI0035C928ED
MIDKNTTHLLEMMKNFMNPEFYINSLTNLPAMDFTSMSETISKSAKIMSTTSQIAAESLQSMIQKNSEAFQTGTMNMLNSAKEAMSSGNLNQIRDFQQKYFKFACETSINNAKDFANMAYDASAKIIDTVNGVAEEVSQNWENMDNKI